MPSTGAGVGGGTSSGTSAMPGDFSLTIDFGVGADGAKGAGGVTSTGGATAGPPLSGTTDGMTSGSVPPFALGATGVIVGIVDAGGATSSLVSSLLPNRAAAIFFMTLSVSLADLGAGAGSTGKTSPG